MVGDNKDVYGHMIIVAFVCLLLELCALYDFCDNPLNLISNRKQDIERRELDASSLGFVAGFIEAALPPGC